MNTYNVLIMGASYGSLLAIKLMFGGHKVKLACLPEEAGLLGQTVALVDIRLASNRKVAA